MRKMMISVLLILAHFFQHWKIMARTFCKSKLIVQGSFVVKEFMLACLWHNDMTATRYSICPNGKRVRTIFSLHDDTATSSRCSRRRSVHLWSLGIFGDWAFYCRILRIPDPPRYYLPFEKVAWRVCRVQMPEQKGHWQASQWWNCVDKFRTISKLPTVWKQ